VSVVMAMVLAPVSVILARGTIAPLSSVTEPWTEPV